MRPLHLIMPMAGEGSRFLKEGWMIPKPLIEYKGIPLFKRAIESIYIDDVEMKYSFIVRQEHIEKYGIDKRLTALYPEANLFAVQKTTRGAVETCLIAESGIKQDEGIVIIDCDLEFESLSYVTYIKQILSKSAEEVNGGVLVSFESTDARYSYAKVNNDMFVTRTAEKEVISNNALCGSYFFSTGRDFLTVAHALVKEADQCKSELYVSLLYNLLLKKGDCVRLAKIDRYYSYGTPEELMSYDKSSNF